MEKIIEQYFIDCEGTALKDDDDNVIFDKYGQPIMINKKPPTVTGLALALGFNTRLALINYQGKPEFVNTVTRAKSYIEAYAEGRLFDRDGVNGAKFSLANNFKGWRDKPIEDNQADRINKYYGIPINTIAPKYADFFRDIENEKHTEYVLSGGRGSLKSSEISLAVIDRIEKNAELHACVLRQVGDTIRTSVFQQVLWAIDVLGLSDEYKSTVSPQEITKISTGQKIYFRGADDANKIKSIKVPFGYIGVLWFEELDQFTGAESVRKIEQSVIRGGDKAFIFKSFNPPKSAQNWANKYVKIPKDKRLHITSTYQDVPEEWLGKPFLDEAEFLKETNPIAYENEYLGIANGTGGNVFDNVIIKEITDDDIRRFDRVYNGIDWGWYPDIYSFMRVAYEPAQHTLYIWYEYTGNKLTNEVTSKHLKDIGITCDDLITCDSAENKSVEDYRAFGLLAKGAIKGPGSREYSFKWLQSLKAIVIDNKRCPIAADEFLNYEYERDKEGNVISGYADGNDHCIDSVRYATEVIWKRRGQ